jgi:hypothetical protein
MGITKKELKAIVKECLVEILAEGVGASINEISKREVSKPIASTSTLLRQNASRVKMQASAVKEAIRREAGGNDVMAAILADTAEKTLPTMLENDRMKTPAPSGKIESIVASHEPEELFGEEAASKWANLAFMGMSKK